MVFLNDKQFPVYVLDTQETRFNRVAWILRTHPIFVSTMPVNLTEDIDEKTVIVGTNLVTITKEDAQKGTIDFHSFYEPIKDKYQAPIEIVLYLWFKSIPEMTDDLKDVIIMDLEQKYPAVRIKDIISHDNYDQTETIAKFLAEQTQIEKELSNFDTIVPVLMDKIDIQKITFEIQFRLNVDLVEIFDRLRMSWELPYANNGPERHKIFKGFKNIGEFWEQGDSNSVQFYVLNTKIAPVKFHEKYYSQGIIQLSNENKGEAVMAIEAVIGSKYELEDLITRVFDALHVDKSAIIKQRQQSVSSTVNIPKQRFSKYIMGDIISNDPLVSSLCYVDESTKIGRVRNGLTFFYQPVGSDEKVTIACTESTVEIKDYRKNNAMYPLESRYIKVRINKAANKSITNEIAGFVGKIFNIYNKNKADILKDYTDLLPGFAELEEKEIKIYTKRGTRLQDLVPDIFTANYARMCLKHPVIVDSIIQDSMIREAKDYTIHNPSPDFKQAILFPKSADEGGVQHWYACPKGMYPGPRKNYLDNSAQYPYLPCCYPQPQNDKKHFMNYYRDYDIKDTTTTFTHILKTPKFLFKDERGTIPKNLEILFQSMMDDKVDFYRTGSPRTPRSFIDAVSIATGRKINVRDITLEMFTTCRQNAYNSTVETLRNELFSSEEYINPSIFYRALEEYCGCYIYIFTREGSLGSLVYPTHKHVFLRYRREKRPIIMLLEHMGTESDAAQYPQCETIISMGGGVKTSMFNGDFAEKIDKVFTDTVIYYAGLQKVIDINPDIFDNIIFQGIDAVGKTRSITVKYKNKEFFIITDPLPPLRVREKSTYKNNEEGLVDSFIAENKLQVIQKTPDKYIVQKNDRTYYIPYHVIVNSTLQRYNQNQRVARYLQEYSYYMYSQYIRTNQMNPNNINTFLREKTVVIPDYDYPRIGRQFDLRGAYLKEGKLIVHSLEMAQRLGFAIELMIRRLPRILVEYGSYELIQEYYLDKNDFTPDMNTIIFMTEEALKGWIAEQSVEYPLHEIPTKDEALFYLKINGNVKLIQRAESLENAIYISRVWNEEKYNSQSVQTDDLSNYMYYLFESPQVIRVEGYSSNKILIWKENDDLHYGSILQ